MPEQAIHTLSVVARSGGPLLPHDLWTAWDFKPSLWLPLLILICIYVWGVHNAWQRAGTGRGITAKQGLSFAGATLVLVLTLMSPLEALSEALFSAHMVQHLILMLVAAPLLVLSDFQLALLWALPRGRAQALGGGFNRSEPLSRGWRFFNHPILAWVLFTLAMWLWHAPVLYEAALRSEAIHVLEHLIFLITAMLFWWVLIKHTRSDRVHYAMSIPYLFLTVLQSSVLGALMTFSSEPWYPYYAASAAAWGLTPLQDQQLAGLIMWMPGGFIFTLLTIGYFAAWLRALDQHSVGSRKHTDLRRHQGVR